MLAVANAGISIAEYYPKEIKKSITGNGNAGKQQVAFMLRKMVALPDEELSNDATDALAVAWCHLMKLSGIDHTVEGEPKKLHQNRSKSGWKEFIEQNPERVKE